jgi:hypothetical protein
MLRFPPFLSCVRPIPTLSGFFLPLLRALGLAQHALRAGARVALKKKTGGLQTPKRQLAGHFQHYTSVFTGVLTLYTHNLYS